MRALTIDVIERLQKSAEIIGSDLNSEDEKLDAMEAILSYVDDIDTAVDFCKIGGLFVLKGSLSSPYAKVRAKAALIVGELAQNNPYCQKEILDADFLPNLMSLLSETETASDGLRAISCLVRSYEPCLEAFIEIGGLECLLGCLQQLDQEKLITKAMFLLNSICVDFPSVRDKLITIRIVDMIIPTIQPQESYTMCLETALSVLCILTENSEAIDQCRAPEFNFKKTLEEVIQVAGDKPECREIVEYSQLLLKQIFDSKSDPEITDR